MLIEAIIGHLVGDYLLQNDWQAAGKKSSSLICALHCAIWTFCVCAFGGFGFLGAAFLFATHFAQDRTAVIPWYMDKVGQSGFKRGPCSPWSVIVVDNIWHILAILVVVKLFGGM